MIKGGPLNSVIYAIGMTCSFGGTLLISQNDNAPNSLLVAAAGIIMLCGLAFLLKASAYILRIGWLYFSIGIAMNASVMWANGGRMPAPIPYVIGEYTPITGANLWFLGDWIDRGNTVMSPGDVFLVTGLALVIIGFCLWAKGEIRKILRRKV